MKRSIYSFIAAGALLMAIIPAQAQKVVKATDIKKQSQGTEVINETTQSAQGAAKVETNQSTESTGANPQVIKKTNPASAGNPNKQVEGGIPQVTATPVTTTTAKAPPPPANVPLTCSWDNTVYDFGTSVVQLKPATATFTITNNGQTPVTISQVQPSCGCTAPSYTKEPIKPGETGKVTLTYDAKISGVFSKSAIVRLNDGQKYSLVIKGNVQKAL